jgi:Tol biopolymer transport system component
MGRFYLHRLAWRPDATELVFASDHEKDCSIFRSDIYSIYPDGSGQRRITNAPACDRLAAYPKGTVVVEVENQTGGSDITLLTSKISLAC